LKKKLKKFTEKKEKRIIKKDFEKKSGKKNFGTFNEMCYPCFGG
jgi:hypothetical protein